MFVAVVNYSLIEYVDYYYWIFDYLRPFVAAVDDVEVDDVVVVAAVVVVDDDYDDDNLIDHCCWLIIAIDLAVAADVALYMNYVDYLVVVVDYYYKYYELK